MKNVKENITLIIFVISAITSVIIDLIIESNTAIFNEANKLLFTLSAMIIGFWISCFLLFVQIFKDRYPIKLINNIFITQMKYNVAYFIYCILFGTTIVIVNGGFVKNIVYLASTIYIICKIIIQVYHTNKKIMVSTYIDNYCKQIRDKLNKNQNSVEAGVFTELKFVLDECIVKEEYYIAQNISKQLGNIFRDFLKNSIILLDNGEKIESINDSFERIVNMGIYQLELCQNINSELLINEIALQQRENLTVCIEADRYEWFKVYAEKLCVLCYRLQSEQKDEIVDKIFHVYRDILKCLINEKKEHWVKFLVNELFSMTSSLNFQSGNTNLKYFISFVVYGLINCEGNEIYKFLYEIFEHFTGVACRISKGFSDIKVYYAIYYSNIIKKKDKAYIKQFFDMIFKFGQDRGNDIAWTEFKFYCIKDVLENQENVADIDINKYHIKLLVEVIEMKEKYNGYMFFPDFCQAFKENQYNIQKCEDVCDDIQYLLNKCIVNDNLNMFFVLIKNMNTCIINTESRNKDIQLMLFDIYIWVILRTKQLLNKQYMEITFEEIKEIVKELDDKKAISKDFGDKIISELSKLAEQTNSDNHNISLNVIDLFTTFLEENKELHFIHNYTERKEKLYRGLYNIGTWCIENNYEEGVRRCSNTMGWFTIYSIRQGNTSLTRYLVRLAKEMLDISIKLQVSRTTIVFLLTLFTTVGMYCFVDANYYTYLDDILNAIKNVDKNLVYTAVNIRTYENDMWNNLLNGNVKNCAKMFKEKYDEMQKRQSIGELI